jgi:MFS family permease
MGITGDRIGSKRALLICFAVFTASFVWLQLSRDIWTLSVFALAYGFCHGGFYALVSPTVAEFFGTRAHGAIFGIVIFIGSVGGAIGPWITGYIFDVTQSYHTAFILLLALSAAGLVSILFSGTMQRSSLPEGKF